MEVGLPVAIARGRLKGIGVDVFAVLLRHDCSTEAAYQPQPEN
jgi:hypothetical protein